MTLALNMILTLISNGLDMPIFSLQVVIKEAAITPIRLAEKVACVPMSMQWPNGPLTLTYLMTSTLNLTFTFIFNVLDVYF